MICERCNTENLDGSQYCDECGAQLLAAPRARRPETGPTENGDGPPAPDAAPHADAPVSAAGSPSHNSGRLAAYGAGRREGGEQPPPAEAPGGRAGGAMTSLIGGAQPPPSSPEGRASSAAGAAFAGVAPHAKLVIHRGRSVGKEFPMSEDETHIGRWDADGGIFPDVDLDADDPEAKVSRRHARITRRGGQYFVEDLGSTNGTFINRGRRLLPGDRHPLNDGDEVIVGKTFLRFQVLK